MDVCTTFVFSFVIYFVSFLGVLSFRWADVGEDKHTKVSLAFLHRKKRLGMMVKLLTKLISSSSKVRSNLWWRLRRLRVTYVRVLCVFW